MPNEKTRGDALRVYWSGAASDGGAGATGLGNYRGSQELHQLGFQGAIENITTELFPVGLGVGTAIIQTDGSGNFRLTEPGGSSQGLYVAVGDGEVKILENSDKTLWARISRSGSAPSAGSTTFKLVDRFNLHSPNITDAERIAGTDKYRAFFIKNESAAAVSFWLYLNLLGTSRKVNASGYAASGAVSITISTGDLNDWPKSGFFENQNTGEVLYYESRTSTVLTVAAGGRDVYSEVGGGSAGSNLDDLYPIPGMRIATEDPASQPSGNIQTIADADSSPTGRTWVHPVNAVDSDAISQINVSAGNILGVWVHQKTLADMQATPLAKNQCIIEHWI